MECFLYQKSQRLGGVSVSSAEIDIFIEPRIDLGIILQGDRDLVGPGGNLREVLDAVTAE
ncbi:MAG: hypothetical protein BGO16_16395 [Nitrobacter sp. 62-23]|nr:MAG: hypothetical protein BGO16_16395 [Nitrobacter sp. 62-23]